MLNTSKLQQLWKAYRKATARRFGQDNGLRNSPLIIEKGKSEEKFTDDEKWRRVA